MKKNLKAAYFSMEIGIEDDIKSYAGGLGILAGDTLKTAADMEIDMVGITLLYKNGYFKQTLTDSGEQIEDADTWDYENILTNTGVRFEIPIRTGVIHVEIWKYNLVGVSGHTVPILFLNTDLPENEDLNKYVSFNLYTPFENTRLKQEIVLGIGGVMAIEALDLETRDVYHLNESHAAFGIIALENLLGSREAAQKRVVFTTHTPAEHGHIVHNKKELNDVLSEVHFAFLEEDFEGDILHMTRFSLKRSKFANAVASKHSEVSTKMFNYPIPGITNGIHVSTWAGTATAALFDSRIPTWRTTPEDLQNVEEIYTDKIVEMHRENKEELIEYVNESCGSDLKLDIFTLGFARRVDGYKRSGFLFYDLDRLKYIAEQFGGLQIIFSGKAYFDYQDGEDHIAHVVRLSKEDHGKLKIVYIPNYGMDVSQLMVQGSDTWLNNPIKPLEASGTSGMKAALNGVPNLSTVDGWWVEGLKEGVTGWAIGNLEQNDEESELNDMYSKLEHIILPMYYTKKHDWAKVMRSAIAYNASYFNTHRMLREYISKGYKLVD